MLTSQSKPESIVEYRVTFVPPGPEQLSSGPRRFLQSLGQVLAQPRRRRKPVRASDQPAEHPEGIPITIHQGDFTFHLNHALLDYIAVSQAKGYRLEIPAGLLADLRHYSLLEESEMKGQDGKVRKVVHLQSGLTFQTDWYGPAPIPNSLQFSSYRKFSQTALRTVISLDGDVLNQIRQEYLIHPEGPEIIAAHYWLSQHLLQDVRLGIRNHFEFVIWLVPLVFIGWTTVANAGAILTQAGAVAAASNVAMSLSSLLVPLLWDAFRDRLLPPLEGALKRWMLSQLINPDGSLYHLARFVFRLG